MGPACPATLPLATYITAHLDIKVNNHSDTSPRIYAHVETKAVRILGAYLALNNVPMLYNAGRSSLTLAQTKIFSWPLHRDNAPVTVGTYPNQTRDQLNELRSLLGYRHVLWRSTSTFRANAEKNVLLRDSMTAAASPSYRWVSNGYSSRKPFDAVHLAA
ncbi:hypothetical protein EAG_04901 [Camponotus floridanus]|uniref:Uncharacterized protein n=1 Tax=Camponotus floridanus TaxID=104421 RepID=E2AT11_CAMFO|nr:hypothetical protein EAG_04901 [Camponotus floridanus]